MGSVVERQIRRHQSLSEIVHLDDAHLPVIRTIARSSFRKVWTEKEFKYFLKHPQGRSIGLIVDHVLTSYLIGLLTDGIFDIVSIATDLNFRRSGMAQRLLTYIERLPGVQCLSLEVEVENRAAVAFYHRLGFRINRRRTRYYANRWDAFEMVKGF